MKRYVGAALNRRLAKVADADQRRDNVCPSRSGMPSNVFDVGPTLYKCYTNVLCLLDGVHVVLEMDVICSGSNLDPLSLTCVE